MSDSDENKSESDEKKSDDGSDTDSNSFVSDTKVTKFIGPVRIANVHINT